MPNHAHTLVAGFAIFLLPGKISSFVIPYRRVRWNTGTNCLVHRHIHRMILMISGHLRDKYAAACILKPEEVAD